MTLCYMLSKYTPIKIFNIEYSLTFNENEDIVVFVVTRANYHNIICINIYYKCNMINKNVIRDFQKCLYYNRNYKAMSFYERIPDGYEIM